MLSGLRISWDSWLELWAIICYSIGYLAICVGGTIVLMRVNFVLSMIFLAFGLGLLPALSAQIEFVDRRIKYIRFRKNRGGQ